MVANDFGPLFDAYPAIEWVCFNGAAAEKNFAKLVPSLNRPIQFYRLPSTSPAQTMRYEDKLAAWRVIASHDTGGRRCAHGRARSICAASDSNVASSNGLPTNLD